MNSVPSCPLLVSIDDEAEMRGVIMAIGEYAGFEAIGVSNPAQIHAAIARNPAVIVLDLIMPDMDGIEVIWALAKRKSQAALILLSGFDPNVLHTSYTIAKSQGLHILAQYEKPVDTGQLHRQLLDIRAQYEQARDTGS